MAMSALAALSRLASTQSASTRTSLRLMLVLLRGSCGGGVQERVARGRGSPAAGARMPSGEGAGRRGRPAALPLSEGATEHGGDAAQVDCPPLREIRLSLHHAVDRREGPAG